MDFSRNLINAGWGGDDLDLTGAKAAFPLLCCQNSADPAYSLPAELLETDWLLWSHSLTTTTTVPSNQSFSG